MNSRHTPSLHPPTRAVVTTRVGGCSEGVWREFNLGDHVGDDPRAVARNRALLRRALELPAEPQWLRQVHGVTVVAASDDGLPREGDAAWTDRPGVVCAVLTADCLPVVLATADGSAVAVAHCGWRGLAAGVLQATVQRIGARRAPLHAWLGPAIGPDAFEVGAEVRETFLDASRTSVDPVAIASTFLARPGAPGKFLADLYELARLQLRALGVAGISGGGMCTVRDATRFFSYRRDGVTGRMATLVWIEEPRRPA